MRWLAHGASMYDAGACGAEAAAELLGARATWRAGVCRPPSAPEGSWANAEVTCYQHNAVLKIMTQPLVPLRCQRKDLC